jgi:exosortase
MTDVFTTIARSLPPRRLGILAGLVAAFLWAYWPTLTEIVQKWARDPQYSHGYLVPIFSLYLLWWRRGQLGASLPGPSWWGAGLLAAGLVLRLAGTYVYFAWLEAVSLLPLLAGTALLLGGWPALRWSWPAIGFLVFMIPLPFRLETGLSQPLQRIATVAATYTLQTLGFSTLAEGNVILVDEARIGVVEACSGLGMLLLFFALATGLAIRIPLPWVDRLLLVASAAPIAVAANVIRITVTAFLHVTAGSRWADLVFHDLAGWLMMPLALGMLWLELRILSRLLVEAPARAREPLRLAPPALLESRRGKHVVGAERPAPRPRGNSVRR